MSRNEYRLEQPYAGTWSKAFIAFVVACMIFVVATYPSPRSWVAGTPALLLGVYLVCFLYMNRYTLTVTREGIRKELGPLPGGERLRVVPRAAVLQVYVRYFEVMAKNGSRFPYQSVGVELADTGGMDLFLVCPPSQEMRDRANQIAAALEWPEQVVELQGGARRRWRWAATWPALCWLLGIGVCVGWASWVLQ